MDDSKVKEQLIFLGMTSIDADILIKKAKNQNSSLSKAFVMSLLGLYMGVFFMLLIYILFSFNMNSEEFFVFNLIYIPMVLLALYFTSSIKKLIWSVKVLLSLNGR